MWEPTPERDTGEKMKDREDSAPEIQVSAGAVVSSGMLKGHLLLQSPQETLRKPGPSCESS